eukprot:5946748-Heterocapsa_arctica.AAC.1
MEHNAVRHRSFQRRGGALRDCQGLSAALGFKSIANDLGTNLEIEIFSDNAAAKDMVRRTGLGKVRHIHVQDLRVQQALREG